MSIRSRLAHFASSWLISTGDPAAAGIEGAAGRRGYEPMTDQGETVPAAKVPPQPSWKLRPDDPTAEYVSGGGYTFIANYIRSLQHYVDDITSDFGEDLYERIMLDAQVQKCVRTLKLSVLSDGLNLRLPKLYDDEDSQYYDDAKAVMEFTERCLERLEAETKRSMVMFLYEMLDGMALGNKVAEQTLRLQDTAEDAGLLCPYKLKTKPRSATSFVVDTYQNVIGLLALIPGMGAPVLQGTILGDPSSVPNMLPRDKFCVFTWDPVNNDPRGRSILRPCYNPWWGKMQVYSQYLKYLAQCAIPSLFATTPDHAQTGQALAGATAVVTTTNVISPGISDPLGNQTTATPQTPEQQLLTQLLNFQGGSALAAPFGTLLNPIQMGSSEPFKTAFDWFDGQIAHAVLLQTLATEEAHYDTEGAAEQHGDILGLQIRMAKIFTAQMVRNDLFRVWTRVNFGDEVADRLTPVASLSPTEHQDWSTKAGAVSQLHTSGYLAANQYEKTDEELGLPARDEPPQIPAPPAAKPTAEEVKKNAKDKGKAKFAFDPAEPRDPSGKWIEHAGATGHKVKLPKNGKKLNIGPVSKALAEMGYKLGSPETHHHEGTWITRYKLTTPDGEEHVASVEFIKKLVYAGHAKG